MVEGRDQGGRLRWKWRWKYEVEIEVENQGGNLRRLGND